MKIAWGPFLVVLVTHILGIAGPIVYGIYHGFTWAAAVVGLVFLALTTFSVSAGYHRLFTHASYEAHWILRLFFAMFGAASVEGSVLKWSSMHRKHHSDSDTENDPHNIKRGFWWAHIGWVIFTDPSKEIFGNVDDLKKDPILRNQDRFYVIWMVITAVLMPLGLGYLLGDPWGGLVIGGFLRIIVFHHITWCINSVAHTFGRKPYSKQTTATDFLPMALLTMGEGYHNFHHTFAFDYRNGVRKTAYDPTKWIVFLLSKVGLTKKLVRASDEAILQALAESK